ncbi:MAG TPA: helix-turn-helix domain-containing protein [Chthoniobacterales bacterium]
MKDEAKLVTTKELAEEYRQPVSTIQRWARSRLIPSIRLGHRKQLFDPEAVRRALLKRTIKERELTPA